MSRRCSLLHVRMLFLLLVSYSKSCSSNSIQENLKPIQTRWNVYDVENYSQKWMRPMHLHKRVCLYFHSLCKKSFGRCARVAQKHFAPMEFKSLHIWFSLPDKRLISDWFLILYLQALCTHHSSLSWLKRRGAQTLDTLQNRQGLI